MSTCAHYLIGIFLLLCLASANIQGQDSLIIGSIGFTGLEKLDENFLRELLRNKVGDLVNEEKIQEDEAQLRRLAAVTITATELNPDKNNPQQVHLIFKITERRTWLPILGIGGIENNFWFLLGLAEYNLAGRNQILSAHYLSNDGLPNFHVFYINPRIKGSRWGWGAEVRRSASEEPLFFTEATVNYRYVNEGIGLTGTYNLSPNRQLSLGTQLFREDYLKLTDADPNDLPGPNDLRQLKVLSGLYYKNNNIVYDYFSLSGHLLEASLQWVHTFGESQPFTSFIIQGNKYWRPYKTVNLAARLRFGIANNRPSPFVPFVLDSQFNLRGVGNRVDRGTAQLVINLEYRQTLFTSGNWASQAVLFSDIGSWRDPGGQLSDLANSDQFRHFFGGGIRIVYNRFFQATFRLDYGVDIYNSEERGFVIGMGQYF